MKSCNSLCQEPAVVTPSSCLSESKAVTCQLLDEKHYKTSHSHQPPTPPPGKYEPYFKGVNTFQTSKCRWQQHHPGLRITSKRVPLLISNLRVIRAMTWGLQTESTTPLPTSSTALVFQFHDYFMVDLDFSLPLSFSVLAVPAACERPGIEPAPQQLEWQCRILNLLSQEASPDLCFHICSWDSKLLKSRNPAYSAF